jgi:hypothetical protein
MLRQLQNPPDVYVHPVQAGLTPADGAPTM